MLKDFFQNHSSSHQLITAQSLKLNKPIPTLKNVESLNILIYPNPVDNDIIIDLPDSEKLYQVILINNLGQEIFVKNNVTSQILKIDSRNFNNGISYILIKAEGKIIFKEKLIIQHD
jgi:hypothetical protein